MEKNIGTFKQLLSQILENEETFTYEVSKPFYFAVHTSTLKTMNMLGQRGILIYDLHLLERIVRSPRINENPWAIKYFSEYLLSTFKKNDIQTLETLAELAQGNLRIYKTIKSHISQLKL